MSIGRNVAMFVDREGRIIEKFSTPFQSVLEMELTRDGYKFKLWAQQSPYGNGRTNVEVKKGRKVLYKASGDMHLNMEVSKYVSGDWERLVPTYK